MRVLHVSHSAQPGGSNGVLLSLLRHAPPTTASACVFLEDGPTAAQANALGARVAIVETGRAREPWRAPRAIGRLRGAIRAWEADAVLAHVSKAHPYAWAAARLEGVTQAWWQHEHQGIAPPLQLVAGALPSALVICSAQWTAAEQRSRFSSPVEVVHPGAEVPDAVAARAHRAGPLRIGVVGRLQRWKRVELALEAFARLRGRLPDAALEVIGDSWHGLDADYPAELRERARSLGIAGAVEFLGHVPDAAARMEELDVLLHCARREPFGLVAVEAMLRGVPVVAPDEAGPREIVRDGVDGRLVDVTDPAAVAGALEALADPAARERMGRAGHARALARFSAERMAADTYRLLGALAELR